MKIKLFKRNFKEHLIDFETRVNDFMATVKVISVKVFTNTYGVGAGFISDLTIAVLYEEVKHDRS